jgi:hypothetical protein
MLLPAPPRLGLLMLCVSARSSAMCAASSCTPVWLLEMYRSPAVVPLGGVLAALRFSAAPPAVAAVLLLLLLPASRAFRAQRVSKALATGPSIRISVSSALIVCCDVLIFACLCWLLGC